MSKAMLPFSANITASNTLITINSLEEIFTNTTPCFLQILPKKSHHWSYKLQNQNKINRKVSRKYSKAAELQYQRKWQIPILSYKLEKP